MTHSIREATEADADGVVRLLDAAMLEFDRERARRRVENGSVLVAVVAGHNRDERLSSDHSGAAAPDERVVGACVLRESDAESTERKRDHTPTGSDHTHTAPTESDHTHTAPTEIEQIAVHRSRRGRGIGATLIDAAATRADGAVVACFREEVRPFYASLGFEIQECEAGEHRTSDDGTGDRFLGVLR